MTDIKQQLASELIKYHKSLAELEARVKKGKDLIAEKEAELISLLKGTGETIEAEGFNIKCSSPLGSVQIKKDFEVPKEWCIKKEIYNPDKKRIKDALQSGESLDFAEIVYEVKLNIKEV